MKILAIDTSCDETAVAITEGRRIISNAIYSQIVIHKKWGGVVPNLAKRAHEEHIDLVIEEAVSKCKKRTSSFSLKDIHHLFKIVREIRNEKFHFHTSHFSFRVDIQSLSFLKIMMNLKLLVKHLMMPPGKRSIKLPK